MSLLDRGNQLVEVFPEIVAADEYGNEIRRPGDPDTDTPVVITAMVSPSTAEEDATLGFQVGTTYRVLSRDFPGGANAVVRWDGRLWDVQGEPKRYTSSPRTAHCTTWIKAREAR